MQKVNPDTQVYFGKNERTAIDGDYPTLFDINAAYGSNFAASWLVPQLTSVAVHSGSNNLTKEQLRSLSTIIATEYRHFKITELLLFFYRFKAGYYGRFYGSVDPMVITCALRDFVKERNELIDKYHREREEEKERDESKKLHITYEQWLAMKEQKEKEK